MQEIDNTGDPGAAGVMFTTGTIEANFPLSAAGGVAGPNLPGFPPVPSPQNAENCGAPFRAVRGCGCGLSIVRDHCDRKTCSNPSCSDRNRKRRGMDIGARMEHCLEVNHQRRIMEEAAQATLEKRLCRPVKPPGLIYTVLTVPPRLRLDMADPKRWRKVLQRLMAYLKEYHGLEYAVERTDPCGEDGTTWHPHANLLWIKKNGKSWVEEAEVQAIKDRWKRILGEHPENPINVYFQYAPSSKPRRRKHLYSYLGRTWPSWEAELRYHLRIKWFGKAPKRPDRVKDYHCKKCGLEIAKVKCGTLEAARDLLARGYESLLAEQHERMAALRRSRRCKGIEVDLTEAIRRGIVTLA